MDCQLFCRYRHFHLSNCSSLEMSRILIGKRIAVNGTMPYSQTETERRETVRGKGRTGTASGAYNSYPGLLVRS